MMLTWRPCSSRQFEPPCAELQSHDRRLEIPGSVLSSGKGRRRYRRRKEVNPGSERNESDHVINVVLLIYSFWHANSPR